MSSPKSRLDQVIASVPQNATAARVVSRGEHYEPALNYGTLHHSKMPIATVPPNQIIDKVARDLAHDLIGSRFGRFTVVGYSADKRKNARWVVRCACGNYETRKPKSIRNPANSEDRCKDCRHLAHIQRTYERLGSRPVIEFAQPAASPVTENKPAAAHKSTGAGIGTTLADVWPGAPQ